MPTEVSIWRPSGSLTGRGIIGDVEQALQEQLVCRPRRQSGDPWVHLSRWVILGQHHVAKACCSALGFCPEEGLPLAETNSREGRGASTKTLNYREHEHEHGNNATLRDEALEGGGWCYTLLVTGNDGQARGTRRGRKAGEKERDRTKGGREKTGSGKRAGRGERDRTGRHGADRTRRTGQDSTGRTGQERTKVGWET